MTRPAWGDEQTADVAALRVRCQYTDPVFHDRCRTHDLLPLQCPGCLLKFCSEHGPAHVQTCARIPENRPVSPTGGSKSSKTGSGSGSGSGSGPAAARRTPAHRRAWKCPGHGCTTDLNDPLTIRSACASCGRATCHLHRFEGGHECLTDDDDDDGGDDSEHEKRSRRNGSGPTFAGIRLPAWAAPSKASPAAAARRPTAAAAPASRPSGLDAFFSSRMEQMMSRMRGAASSSSGGATASATAQRRGGPALAAPPAGTRQSKAAAAAAVQQLIRTATGQDSIPAESRVYVELVIDQAALNFPPREPGDAAAPAPAPRRRKEEVHHRFYNKAFSVGRLLDAVTKEFAVKNVNNSEPDEASKLSFFHHRHARFLPYNQKLSACCINGDRIVLFRGVQPE